MLIPLDEHQLLVFWTQLLVLVTMARLCGELMRRINLPSVIGQLAAGVILGPSIFGRVWEDGFHWFLPDYEISSGALLAVSWLGVALLLVTAGFETDLALIRRLGKAAALVTGFSLVVPLVGGLAVGLLLPDSFIGAESNRTVFALFVAAALSVSALAVIAKILSELGLMRRDFGQITVAAGMANDVVGWVMLAIFAGFAASGEVSVTAVLKTVIGLAMFLAIAMTIGQRVVDQALRWVRRDGANIPGAMTVVVMTMLVYGVATQALGIEAVLGAFVAGVVLHRSRFQQPEVLHHVESLTTTFLAPVFFATAGLRVDLGLLGEDDALVWALIVIAVAIVFKFAGAFIGARLAGQSGRAATALGAGLNARGALEIVIASVGLSLGVFNETAYTVIVIVPLVTSIFAAVSLRIVVRDWRGSEAEQERLDREEALSRNLVVKSSRILLPSQGEPASIAAAQLVQFAWPTEAPVTVASVRSDGEWPDVSVVEAVLDEREVDHRQLKGDDVAGSIVSESLLGYGVIAVGVAARHEGQLYSPMVDELLLNATLPLVIVRRARGLDRPLPAAFSRVIVPVTGTRSSRSAQEVAFSISSTLGTEVVLTHVLNRTSPLPRIFGRRVRDDDPAVLVANQLVETASTFAGESGIEPRSLLKESDTAGTALVDAARSETADLVVLGAQLRNVDGRPFLGHTVETVLEQSDATVVVVAHPRRSVNGDAH
ncbi:MAG: cation:proton antiporter [Acidimicrobiales bacterium]|jgi:Kef-type K+ transport system membrane component KefB/nucleotide-binding universal stress UspA family protein|nr:cation:proton antiporter [Acidimicrobiales bacterium]